MTAQPRIVALDLGGVIVDVAHEHAQRTLGVTAQAWAAAFFHGDLHDRLTVGAVDGAAFVEDAARRLGAGVDVARVREAWASVVNVVPAGRALVDDLLARGVVVHLWSNTDPIHMERMATQLPAAALSTTASFRIGAMKPHTAFYEKARAFGEPVVFLDDLEANVAAAARAGVHAVRCQGPVEARKILAGLGLV